MTDPALDRDTRDDVAELLVRYATGIDRRDWPLFRSCFTDDCVADYGEIGSWPDADTLTEWMRQIHARCGHTLHRVTNQSVVAVHRDRVAARCYVDAIVMAADNENGSHAVGYFDDELRRTDEGWKICRRNYTLVVLTNAVDQ